MKIMEKEFGHQNPKPVISVIIVAYKTNLELKDCLDSLNNQVYKNFETIVVDNDSEDIKLLEQFPMRYFRLDKNYGPSYARNYGAEKARGQLLAFLDDDAITNDNWTINILKAFEDKSVVGIRGKVKLKTKAKIYNSMPECYDLGDYVLNSPLTTEGNSAVRRKEFLEAGCFNTKLYGQEGAELSYRLKEYGKLIYDPNVIILHDAGDNLKHFLKREYRSGYNGTLYLFQHPEVHAYNTSFGYKIKFKELHRQEANLKIQSFINIKLSKIAYHVGSMTYRARVALFRRSTSDHIR